MWDRLSSFLKVELHMPSAAITLEIGSTKQNIDDPSFTTSEQFYCAIRKFYNNH